MLELVAQVLAYTGVGIAILGAGFWMLDLLTPGHLGRLVVEQRNPNAGLVAGAGLLSLGLILWFAIFFTGAGWSGLDDAAVFGAVGVVTQAIGFLLLDLITPGKLREEIMGERLHPGAVMAAAMQFALALVVAASLT